MFVAVSHSYCHSAGNECSQTLVVLLSTPCIKADNAWLFNHNAGAPIVSHQVKECLFVVPLLLS